MGAAQVYESSPECITTKRMWGHPGNADWCLSGGIGDETQHVLAPRRLPHGYFRETGWDNGNRTLEDSAAAVENWHPLWSIND